MVDPMRTIEYLLIVIFDIDESEIPSPHNFN
jgi:hypothetical protein